ncbi:Glycosyl transferase 4-like domain-containing protein [Actinopolyspora alba]|uniref:Glycosyl transferase 4-like domain-containing protein n=1 Tax=Actinopolyspora alba TaxID=673379 RepID=A0A1I1XN85_9ACTN|nr:glycosyltransferase [Actinopolyspora alba]SFE08786.1 Glycosyl transferase 4-like domain-containing protein [Actinopolyspora alba]
MSAPPWPLSTSAASSGPTVAVLLDTAGFLRTLPLTGAAARTARLNAWLHRRGAETTLLLCDLNPASRPSGAWPLPVRYLPYASVYEHTDRLRLHLAELAPDVLVLSNTQLTVRYGRELAEEAGAALVYEMHDDEAALLRSLGDAGQDTAAVLQTAAVAAADGVITFTDRDAATARRLGTTAVHVVPCGVDPGPAPRSRSSAESRVVFVGNGYYEPNRRAMRWLHEVLAPSLPPGTVIEVIGRYPASLRELADRVRLRGPVRDLRSALDSATVAVAPLETGGGMKLKVLDYCAAGLPVVGTAEAFVGFAETEQWAVEADLAELPGHVTALLGDEVRRHRLGRRARHLVEQRYSWSAQARAAHAAYSAILEQHRAGTRGSVPDAEARALAAEPPYWLREWRGHTTSRTHAPE